MIHVAKEDVLRGLKKFKRLAKQDLLASDLTSNPSFWSKQAESRRSQYDQLMELITEQGVEMAYRIASKEYATLPLDSLSSTSNPEMTGKQQAYEMFFTILGVGKETLGNQYEQAHSCQQDPDGFALNASL